MGVWLRVCITTQQMNLYICNVGRNNRAIKCTKHGKANQYVLEGVLEPRTW